MSFFTAIKCELYGISRKLSMTINGVSTINHCQLRKSGKLEIYGLQNRYSPVQIRPPPVSFNPAGGCNSHSYPMKTRMTFRFWMDEVSERAGQQGLHRSCGQSLSSFMSHVLSLSQLGRTGGSWFGQCFILKANAPKPRSKRVAGSHSRNIY